VPGSRIKEYPLACNDEVTARRLSQLVVFHDVPARLPDTVPNRVPADLQAGYRDADAARASAVAEIDGLYLLGRRRSNAVCNLPFFMMAPLTTMRGDRIIGYACGLTIPTLSGGFRCVRIRNPVIRT
jgi:hypothetical protein